MKKILVPTDFSDNANKALSFAIAIANRFKAGILLYHVYSIGSSAAETFKSKVDEIVREDKEKAMKQVIAQFKPMLEPGSEIDGRVARGNVEDLIVSKADKEHFDIVVMGTEGETGMATVLFGSTAREVIRRTDTPVIAIPAGAEPRPVQHIILAEDGQGISSKSKLDTLIEMARSSNAKITIFHKQMDEEAKELHPSIAAALEELDYSYHSVETSIDDVSDSIKAFVEAQEQADLLCLINRRKGWLARMFKENVTSDSLIDSPIPLLVIKD